MARAKTGFIPLRVEPVRRGGAKHRREDRELAQLAKALGHPARVAILRLLLSGGECICGDLVDRLPLAQATVSQHLKVLKEAGWIRGQIDGPRVCYCAEPDTGRKLLGQIGALISNEERRSS
jgi:ArsR family transcriptional regulator, arsenate/arsenite/antimonite-responsive transcriptional repressor